MKIRIAVAVDEDGRWQSGGIEGTTDECRAKWAMDRLLHGCADRRAHIVYVEADVPLPPEPQTVAGKVTH